ncbi:hypothetical protein [Methylobacterium sp. WL120]|uniref:hypothetical protein n=1 Tax=Methylobacterium sp. WL120 TaxID=2603887 RepID=UPI0011C76531|nr:hypothetical protein [Methylobacterium sp. WL120]TXM66654.1 hypothetical protein FV229_12200 [Methylobacterium sp. WL120]
MRRAIIHIGMPRTGSTSLQLVLATLRPRLAEAGLLYPDLAPEGARSGADVNHQGLGEALDGRRPRAERRTMLARLDRALADTDADTVILSYEDFSVQRPSFGVPRTLSEVFARRGFAMEVVMAVKPPFEFLNSAYAHRAQLVKEPRTFREYARAHRRSGRLDYRALIAPWAQATDGAVTAVPLRDARSDATLVERFVAALGLAGRLGPMMDAAVLGTVTNRSSGPLAVEASRRLRSLRVHRQVDGHPRRIGHVLDQAAWSRGLDPEPFRGDAPELAEELADRFAATCARFAELAWGLPWDRVVAAAPARAPNEWAGRPIPAEAEAQIALLMRETMRRFDFRRPPAWRRVPAECVERATLGAARLAGFESRWRVS